MQKRLVWSTAALCAALLFTSAPLYAKGGGGSGGAGGSVAAGGAGDVGGGGSGNLNANANSNNKKGNGNANGNGTAGGNGTNGDSGTAATSNTNATAKNKNGRLTIKVVASGSAGAEADQGNNSAQAGGGTTLKAKGVGGTSDPKAKTSVAGSTKVVGDGNKIKVVNGTPVYVDNNGRVIAKVACDGGNCSAIIASDRKVIAWSGHIDIDGDFKASDLYAATKTAGFVTVTATRRSVSGGGSFFAGAVARGGNSGAVAQVGTHAFAKVQVGSGPRKSTTSVSSRSRCSANTFLQNNVMCKVR